METPPFNPATAACYRHGDRSAAVNCQRCERPICPDCMTQASVGHHCPECVADHGQRVVTPAELGAARPPLTSAILIVNLLAYAGQFLTADRLTTEGLLFGPLVAEGELWRIVTSGFLHGSLMHIGFNMYALWLFGRALESGIGSLRYGLIYLAGLLGGAAAVLGFNFAIPTLGASGAVLGLAGGIAGVFLARGRSLNETGLVGIFVINLALPIIVPGISFWGHLGGIAAGFVAGWLLTYLPERAEVRRELAVAGTLGFCAALFGLCLFLAA